MQFEIVGGGDMDIVNFLYGACNDQEKGVHISIDLNDILPQALVKEYDGYYEMQYWGILCMSNPAFLCIC